MAKKLQLGYREIEQRLADSFSTNGVNSAEVGYQLLYSFGGRFVQHQRREFR